MLERLFRRLRGILRDTVPGDDLSTGIVRSGMWETALNIGKRGLEFLSIVVLARLLGPRAFGLLGIALVVISGLNRFSQLGLNEALIYHRDENVDGYLDTMWIMEIVRGFIIAAIVFLVAPYAATFFSEPRVTDVLRFLALSPLLKGFANPGVVYFTKDLNFHRKFVYRMSGSVVQFGLAVGYALVVPSVWALVFGFVAADIVRTVLSYPLHAYRPALAFDTTKARELFSYGKWVTSFSILNFLIEDGDDIVVGWLLSATALGYYRIAYRVGNAPSTELTQVVSDVLFAAYSKIQDDAAALRKLFLQTIQLVSVLSFPAAVGIVVVAPPFVEVVLGQQWLRAVTVVQLLTLLGLTTSVTSVFHYACNAVGRPDYGAKISAVQLVVMALLIFPAAELYGLNGVGAAVVLASVSVIPIETYFTLSLIEVKYRDLFREIGYPLVASVLMGLAVLGLRETIGFQSALAELLSSIALGVVVYTIVTVAFDELFGWGVSENVQIAFNALRG